MGVTTLRVLIVCGPLLYGTSARAVQNRRLARALASLNGNVVSVLSFDKEVDGQAGNPQFLGETEVVRFLPSTTFQTIVRKMNLIHSAALNRAAEEFTQNFIYPKSDLLIGALRRRMVEFQPDITIFVAQPFYIPLLGLQLEPIRGMRKIAFFSDPWPYRDLPPLVHRLLFVSPAATASNLKDISHFVKSMPKFVGRGAHVCPILSWKNVTKLAIGISQMTSSTLVGDSRTRPIWWSISVI